jgi:CBS domain-containing membrane protein
VSLAWSVADLMTRDVRTVGANDPVAAAKALMDSGGFRHVVVVDEEGAIEGVLSHRDLFFGPLAWSIGQGQAAYEKLLNASRVKDVTHGDVATIDATAPLQEAATLMRERKIGCLPVVEGDRLVGVLTEGDFVELVAQASHWFLHQSDSTCTVKRGCEAVAPACSMSACVNSRRGSRSALTPSIRAPRPPQFGGGWHAPRLLTKRGDSTRLVDRDDVVAQHALVEELLLLDAHVLAQQIDEVDDVLRDDLRRARRVV